MWVIARFIESVPHACRRVYFHSRLEIAGHRSNIIIAMTGVALEPAWASAVESRCRDGGRFRCVWRVSAGTRTGPDNVTSYSSSPELVAVSRFPAFEEEPWLRETLVPIPVVIVAARGPAASIDRVRFCNHAVWNHVDPSLVIRASSKVRASWLRVATCCSICGWWLWYKVDFLRFYSE